MTMESYQDTLSAMMAGKGYLSHSDNLIALYIMCQMQYITIEPLIGLVP